MLIKFFNILLIGVLAVIYTLIAIAVNADNKNIEALANNIYFEARNSSIEDQIATAVVVMNRGVPVDEVYKSAQFSWTSEYSKPADNMHYQKAKAIAKMVYDNHDLFKSKNICKHYTVAKEYPKGHWTKKFKRRTQIGKHYYYCP